MNRALLGAAALLVCAVVDGQDITAQIREGNRLRAAGRFEAAEKVYTTALKDAPGHHRATLLNNLGAVHYDRGNLAEAEKAWKEAVDYFGSAADDSRLQYATALINLAELHRARGDQDRALAMHEKVLAIREELSGPKSLPVASSMNAMAVLYMDRREPARAVESLERGLAIREHLRAPEDAALAALIHNLGEALRLAGRLAEAKARMEQALDLRTKLFGEQHAETAATLANFGALLEDLGQPEDALAYVQRALAIRRQVLPVGSSNITASLNNAGHLLTLLGRTEESLQLLNEAVESIMKFPDRHSPRLHAVVLLNLAECHVRSERPEAADPLFRESIGIFARVQRRHPDAVAAYSGFARLLISQGRLAAAEKMLSEAIATSKAFEDAASPQTVALTKNLAEVLRAQRRETEAEKLEKSFR